MKVLRDSANGIDRLIGVFDEGQRALFDRYARVVAAAPFDGSDTPYETARRLEAALQAAGCGAAFEVASNLADAGIQDFSAEEEATFAAESARPVAKSLYLLSVIFRSGYIIDQAVLSASNAIAAVRAYASSMKTEGEARDFDLKASIERALSLFRDKLGSSYTIEKRLKENALLRGDEAAFIRMWTHLIQNALDAMPSGGRLTLELREVEGGYAVSVADTGSGVRPEIRDRIFEAFVTSKPVEEGLGIGLAYCKRVAEGSGGSIDFETGEAGTVFSVTLPRERKPT
jgi:signal transduction histidine kinase